MRSKKRVFRFGVLFILLSMGIITYSRICSKLENIVIIDVIGFSTMDGEFQFDVIPQKGRSVKMMRLQWKEYKTRKHILEDVKIYRTTAKDWSNFCQWPKYLTKAEWRYPYMDSKNQN